MAGNKTKATTNIKYGSGIPTSEAAGKPLNVASSKLKKVAGKVLVNENYKRGKDAALDHVLKDIITDKI